MSVLILQYFRNILVDLFKLMLIMNCIDVHLFDHLTGWSSLFWKLSFLFVLSTISTQQFHASLFISVTTRLGAKIFTVLQYFFI